MFGAKLGFFAWQTYCLVACPDIMFYYYSARIAVGLTPWDTQNEYSPRQDHDAERGIQMQGQILSKPTSLYKASGHICAFKKLWPRRNSPCLLSVV